MKHSGYCTYSRILINKCTGIRLRKLSLIGLFLCLGAEAAWAQEPSKDDVPVAKGPLICTDSIWTADDIMEETKPVSRKQWMAIKTNVLYDAILMPSLEIECKLSRHWSLALEGDVAWWKKTSANQFYQVATVSPEVRYKFKTDRPWHGHYLGLFAGFSWYDLGNKSHRYQGKAGMLGLSYSHMWSLSRHFSLETGLGAGALITQYEQYKPISDRYVYQQTRRMLYLGPLELKFALVWCI